MLWIAWSAALAAAKQRGSTSSNGERGWSRIREYEPRSSSPKKPRSMRSDTKRSDREAPAEERP